MSGSRYAERRVPELALAVASGQAIQGARAVSCAEGGCRGLQLHPDRRPAMAPQQPRLFAFKGSGATMIAP